MKASVYIPDELLLAAQAADRTLADRNASVSLSPLVQRALAAYVEEAARRRRRRRASQSPLAKLAKVQAALAELDTILTTQESTQ